MIKTIKKFLVLGATSLAITVTGLVPALAGNAYAQSSDLSNSAGSTIASGLCAGINTAANGAQVSTTTPTHTANCPSSTGPSISDIATTVINIFSIIVGIVAVIMIIVGGFRYVTSGGASDKVGGAKNTLIYAIIGLIIVALAQAIVHFVLNTATTTGP